jgi:apolipoprotein N-acyltransferase
MHLGSTVIRAVENRMHILLISNSGISAFISPRGDILQSIPFGSRGYILLK